MGQDEEKNQARRSLHKAKAWAKRCWARRKTRLATLSLALALALLYLSDTSLYRIRGVSDITLELALMLTPYGIARNLVFEANHWLRPYYYEPASRIGVFDDWTILAGVVLVAGLAIALLSFAYRATGKRDGA